MCLPHCCGNRSTSCWKPRSNSTHDSLGRILRRSLCLACLRSGDPGHAAAAGRRPVVHARNGTAFAVTPTLRESYAEGDDDELAEVALREAALASLRLLAGRRDEPRRGCRRGARCWWPTSRVRRPVLTSTTPWCGCRADRHRRLIAAYVDNADAEPAVLAGDRGRRRRRSGRRGRRTHRRRRAGPRSGLVCHAGAALPARAALTLHCSDWIRDRRLRYRRFRGQELRSRSRPSVADTVRPKVAGAREHPGWHAAAHHRRADHHAAAARRLPEAGQPVVVGARTARSGAGGAPRDGRLRDLGHQAGLGFHASTTSPASTSASACSSTAAGAGGRTR